MVERAVATMTPDEEARWERLVAENSLFETRIGGNCFLEGCGVVHHAHGLCQHHYNQWNYQRNRERNHYALSRYERAFLDGALAVQGYELVQMEVPPSDAPGTVWCQQ